MITKFEQFIEAISESFKMTGDKFIPKKIKFHEFSRIMNRGGFEGIVLLGAGGDSDE